MTTLKIHALSRSARLAPAAIDAFLEEHEFPLVEGRQASFVFHGRADELRLRHWILVVIFSRLHGAFRQLQKFLYASTRHVAFRQSHDGLGNVLGEGELDDIEEGQRDKDRRRRQGTAGYESDMHETNHNCGNNARDVVQGLVGGL